MRITPLEIRQKSFEKKLRGYDKDEVQAFLTSLSQEWERVNDENKELRIKFDQSEKEVQKLREVENSLFKTLKTAEDTGANLVDQANKAAALHLKETQMNAEALMTEAREKAKAIVNSAENQARKIVLDMENAVKNLESNYKTIENQRDSVSRDLKVFSADILARVEKLEKEKGDFQLDQHLQKVKQVVNMFDETTEKNKVQPEAIKPIKPPQVPGSYKQKVLTTKADIEKMNSQKIKEIASSLNQPAKEEEPKKEKPNLVKAPIKRPTPPKSPKDAGHQGQGASFFDELGE